MSLPEKQQQSDLIRLIKYVAGTNICRTLWEWVEGHAVERKGWGCSTLPKRLNDQANKLAKKSLIHAIAGEHVMMGNFPFEVVKLKLLGKRVCRPPRRVLEYDLGILLSTNTVFGEGHSPQGRLFSNLVGWSSHGNGAVPKNVSCVVNQACIRVLWEQRTAVLLEQGDPFSKVRVLWHQR
jgi:hypothetical protein